MLLLACALTLLAAGEPLHRALTNSAILLKPARVFDAEGQTREGWSVLVTNNQIAAVGPAAEIKAPRAATEIDLSGMTLLPGLMDIHSTFSCILTTKRYGTIRSLKSRWRIAQSWLPPI